MLFFLDHFVEWKSVFFFVVIRVIIVIETICIDIVQSSQAPIKRKGMVQKKSDLIYLYIFIWFSSYVSFLNLCGKKIYIYHRRNEENVCFFSIWNFQHWISVRRVQIWVTVSNIEALLVSNSRIASLLPLPRQRGFSEFAIAKIRAKLRKCLNLRSSFNRIIGKTHSN